MRVFGSVLSEIKRYSAVREFAYSGLVRQSAREPIKLISDNAHRLSGFEIF